MLRLFIAKKNGLSTAPWPGSHDAIATAVNKTAEANPSLKSTAPPRTPTRSS